MKYYTHAGLFHCDEVTGWIICKLARKCDDLVRLTDITNIPDDGLVADIGREYDPANLRFDHHQGFILREDGFPYASAGLLWKEFGLTVIENLISKEEFLAYGEDIVQRVDDKFIKGIDAHDSDNDYLLSAKCCAGEVNVYSLSNVLSYFNAKDVKDHTLQRNNFLKAAAVVQQMVESQVQNAAAYFRDAERFDQISDFKHDEIVVMTDGINWKDIVHENYPDLKFIVLPSNHPGNPFSLQAVTIHPKSRECKILIERSDTFDGFIHQGKWIAGGNSPEELVELAEFNLHRAKSAALQPSES